MAISHCYWHLVIKNGNFTLLLTFGGQEWQLYIATDIWWSRMVISHCYWHLVVKNGNFTLLMKSSGQEWPVHIAIEILWSGISTDILVFMNGNLIFLLTFGGQEWQLYIATDIWWSRMVISHCYWHLVVKNGLFTLLLRSCGQEVILTSTGEE